MCGKKKESPRGFALTVTMETEEVRTTLGLLSQAQGQHWGEAGSWVTAGGFDHRNVPHPLADNINVSFCNEITSSLFLVYYSEPFYYSQSSGRRWWDTVTDLPSETPSCPPAHCRRCPASWRRCGSRCEVLKSHHSSLQMMRWWTQAAFLWEPKPPWP